MRRLLIAVLALVATPLVAVAQGGVPDVSWDVLKDLAPTGRIRVAINFGNAVLVQKGPSGEAKGITPDLAAELGRRLGVPVEFVAFDAAGKAFEAAKVGAVDVLFIAIEPVRAAEVEFSPPYVIIEGTYMVPVESSLKDVDDVDKPGIRFSVGLGSAYDLYLTRTIKNATIVRASAGGGRAMIDLFLKDKLDAAAGVRQQLAIYAKDHPEVRIMPGHFQEIQQAMGTPKGRLAGVAYLRTFIEDVKANGFVADAIKRAGQSATVAPPAR